MKYGKEIVILILQVLLFYVFPLTAGPGDEMGMVLLMLMGTFVLSGVLGALSDKKVKYFYPAAAAVLFLPSVFLYYNGSALIHAVWYLVVSAAGLLVGAMIRFCIDKFTGRR